MKKSIVVVDDHVSIRDMLVWILMREPGYQVIGEAGSGIDALRVCNASQPDLLILDLALPCISGPEVLRRVRKAAPATRVLIPAHAIWHSSGTPSWSVHTAMSRSWRA